MSQVTISGLKKSYGDARVIDDLTVTVNEGEFFTLLGPSGCGKTTTLRCVAGLERPDEGTVAFGDQPVVSSNPARFVPPESRGVGMVFQSYALWPHMTVGKNVSYGLERRRRPRPVIRERVTRALEQVGLAGYENRSPSTLSGGQQQRVALARSIASDPQVMLYDEPLSNLDTLLRRSMRAEIKQIHRSTGTTTLYVTHDQTEAMTLSHRIMVMNRGRVEQLGRPREIFDLPKNRFVADFVGFDVIVPAIYKGDVGDNGSAYQVGAEIVEISRRPQVAEGASVLLAARSVHCDVRPGHSSDRGWLPATVVEVSDAGDELELSLELATGQRLVIRSELGRTVMSVPARGDAVDLRLPRDKTVPLNEMEEA